MKQMIGLIIGVALLWSLGSFSIIAEGPSQLTDEQLNQIKELISKLGADDWQTREEATQALIKMGRAIEPLIKQLLENPDPEVQTRAKYILGEINSFIPLQKLWNKIEFGKELSSEEETDLKKEITRLLEKLKTEENLSESLQKALQEVFFYRINPENRIIIGGGGGNEGQIRIQIRVVPGGGRPDIKVVGKASEEAKQLEEQYARLTKLKTEKTKDKETLLKEIDEVKKLLKENYEKIDSIKYKELSEKDQENLLEFILRLCGIDKEFLDNYQPESPKPPVEQE